MKNAAKGAGDDADHRDVSEVYPLLADARDGRLDGAYCPNAPETEMPLAKLLKGGRDDAYPADV